MKPRSQTQIICTIGPSSEDELVLEQMYINGMDIVRLNMSHSSYSSCQNIIDAIRKIEQKYNSKIPIALDTRGPELRITVTESFSVGKGEVLQIVPLNTLKRSKDIGVNVERFESIKENSIIKISDSKFLLKIISVDESLIRATAMNSFFLETNKQIHFEFTEKNVTFLSKDDKEDLNFAKQQKLDMIFLSFSESIDEVLQVKEFLANNETKIFAKIESKKGVRNSQSIANACDGIMIARGDLFMDVGIDLMFSSQKKIIKQCKGSKIIMATELIQSMTKSIVPLRAEISDIGNAVLDGCYALMLSSETSVGDNPALCVDTLRRICIDAESLL